MSGMSVSASQPCTGHLSPSNHITSNCCIKSKSREITGLNWAGGRCQCGELRAAEPLIWEPPLPPSRGWRVGGLLDPKKPFSLQGRSFCHNRRSGRRYAWSILSCWCFSINFLLKQTNPITKQTLWHCHPTPVSCLDPLQTFPFVHLLRLIPALKLQNKSPRLLVCPFLSTFLATALLWSC